jgi:hypothetical protein
VEAPIRSRSPQLLSLEETALVLGIGLSTIQWALRDGRVPFPVYPFGGSGMAPSGCSSASWRARRQRARSTTPAQPDSADVPRKVWIKVRITKAVVKVGRRPPGGPGLDDGVPESPTATM